MVKHLPTVRETWVQSLGQEDLEKEMATHSSILAWKIPCMEEPGRLQSTGSQRAGHDWATSLHFIAFFKVEDDIWGKAKIVDGNLQLGGGNMGSNGTHEFYVFKVNTANASGKTPSGQPLPGIIATLIVGGGSLLYLKKRKKLYASKWFLTKMLIPGRKKRNEKIPSYIDYFFSADTHWMYQHDGISAFFKRP